MDESALCRFLIQETLNIFDLHSNLPRSVAAVGQGHVASAKIVEHPEYSKFVINSVTRLDSDQAGNLLLAKGLLNILKVRG